MSARQPKQSKPRRRSGAGKAPAERPRDDIRAFMETGAMKPDEQLGLVLRFLREELDEGNGLTWSSRLKGLPLRPLASESGRLKIQWQALSSYEALPLPALTYLQTLIRSGLRALVAPEPGDKWTGVWPLPCPSDLVMARDRDGVLVWQYHHTDTAKSDEGTVSMITLAAARLFAEHADHVRACAWCKRIFLAVKRQAYCTPQHAQLARDQKKKAARNGGGEKGGA